MTMQCARDLTRATQVIREVSMTLLREERQRVRATDEVGGSMSIDSFCRRNEISRSFFYRMRRLNIGPAEMKLGSIIRISYSAEAAWLKKRARGTKTA